MNLNSSLGLVKGVGEKTLEKLESVNLQTVGDILEFFPRKYEDFASLTSLSEIKPGRVLFKAYAEKVSMRRVRRGMTITEAILTDGKDKIKAIWFNQPYRVKQLQDEEEFFFSGKYEFNYNRYQITNPSLMKREELPKNQNFSGKDGEIIPIYPQKKGLKTETIRKILTELKPIMKILPETLPEIIVRKEKLISRAQAIEWVHFPSSAEEFNLALERLAFDEIFELILAAKLNKIENEQLRGYNIEPKIQDVRQFVEKLPFNLTQSQRLASWEIMQNMSQDFPMNRLLQGDVGSGKTTVAAIAALNAVKNGYQVAVFAPTEILAQQLAENFSKTLTWCDISIGFLSGKVKGKVRKTLFENLKNGNLDILVGTSAIIQEKVEFSNLGLVIIDEQHRFGVAQRQKILEKSHQKMPHLLAMTATPIPRSLQLTLFGDLSISILKEKPKGRKPVQTEIISPASRAPMNARIKAEISNGRQVFAIVPAIQEGKNEEIKSVEAEFKRLKHDFKEFRILQLHGKMKSEEKEQIMADFLAKKADILLSTTVIEVGIDVPNASVIVIENADRFGLAQLHQLRGRVGRGGGDAFCYLVMSSNAKPPQRLQEISKTNDGFILAEKDLELRGAGEIYGKAQSGESNLEFASIGDVKMISRAQSAVNFLFENQKYWQEYLREKSKSLEKYQRLTLLN